MPPTRSTRHLHPPAQLTQSTHRQNPTAQPASTNPPVPTHDTHLSTPPDRYRPERPRRHDHVVEMRDDNEADRDTSDQTTTGRDRADRTSAELTNSGQADDAYARRLDAVMAGHRGDVDAAVRLLADEDASVRVAALGALARCDELSAEQIRSALSDGAPQVRRRAVELAPPAVDLVPMLDDPEASVVEAAAAALGERDWDPAPVPELCRIARSHDDSLCRESAVAALGAIAAGIGAITAGVGSHPGTDTHAADAADIGARHDDARASALDALLSAMEDRPQIRRRALLGLHQFDDDRAVDAVRASLEDRDRQVRAVAGELLGVPVR